MKATRSAPIDASPINRPESGRSVGSRIVGRVLLFFLFFVIIRFLTEAFFAALTLFSAPHVPEKIYDFLVIEEGGEIVDLSGNWQAIVTGISFAFAACLLRGKSLEYSRKYSPSEKKSPLFILLSCIASVALALALNLLIVKTGIAASSAAYQEVAVSQYSCAFLIGILVYGIISPLSEELLFRGIVFNGVKGFMGWKPSLFLTSVLFAVYHGNGVQGIYALVMSLLITFMYEKSGSLLIPVLMHASANIASYILTYLLN